MKKLSSVQDVDRCVRCHHTKWVDENGICGELEQDGANEGDISRCGCKCEFPSPSVSEAAPERIWIQKDTSFFQATGNGTYYRDPDKNSIEYARVHQPPEQNLEDKNSVSGASDLSQIVIPKDSSESAYDHATYWDLNDIAGRRGYSLAHLPYVETPAARRELIDWLTAYDKRLLVPNPITQDAGGLPSTTVPDHGQASFTKSDCAESESTLVTVDEVSKEQDNAKS